MNFEQEISNKYSEQPFFKEDKHKNIGIHKYFEYKVEQRIISANYRKHLLTWPLFNDSSIEDKYDTKEQIVAFAEIYQSKNAGKYQRTEDIWSCILRIVIIQK